MNTNAKNFFESIKNKTVAFCGLGKTNLPLIKLFREKKIRVIACDVSEEKHIAQELAVLRDLGVEVRLGKGYLDNLDMDIIFRTPGMNFFSPELEKAQNSGVIVTSEMEVFFDLCPCRIIGVTGSDGKTTTATLIYEMLKKAGKTVYLGGNIGNPLLPIIESIAATDFIVAELSSFQLISMRRSPDIAVVTNVSPNHLDVHKDMDEYVAAKKNIIAHQNAFSKAIFNLENFESRSMAESVRSQAIFFSNSQNVSRGTFVKNGTIYFNNGKKEIPVLKISDIKIPGQHNVENFMASICAVFDFVDIDDINFVAQNFSGVEHRIEFVCEKNGVKFFNDSIASSPTRVIKGTLSVFDRKIILIAGGYDKKIPFNELALEIIDKVKVLVLLGQTAQRIEEEVKSVEGFKDAGLEIIRVNNMEEAVDVAYIHAGNDDIVALSPASASFDLYKNFDHRGKDFKRIVNSL